MLHLEKNDLIDYAIRNQFSISDDRKQRIESHLRECPDCAAQLKPFEERALAASSMRKPEEHVDSLISRMTTKRRFFLGWPAAARVAAVLAVCLMGYGSVVYYVNDRFDHGPLGLAEFQEDYEFALQESVSRGNEKEPEDIRLFKEGVRTLFEAKRTTVGLFPRYDEVRLSVAVKLLIRAKTISTSPKLKEKVTALIRKFNVNT